MGKLAFFQELLAALEEQRPAVAATVVKVEGEVPGMAVGSHFLWMPDGRYEGPGAAVLEETLGEVAPGVLAGHRPRLETVKVKGGNITLFLEPVLPEPRILILGGGHVGQQVAAAAKLVGYRVTVVDDRPDFANKALFPAADRIICAPFTTALQEIEINPSTFIVIVTRGHRYDYECLRAVIQAPAAYIGMIGSRRRVQGVRERLLEEGVDPQALARVHAPIGLDIGAETPAEIAISILAEIIRVYRRGV
ncbi:putative xanthine dehydrogenase subunit A [Moorella thermoacetica]|uniref:Xanthine dehydrogenase subunit A n=2 Tax=Neomoorella thermoacetica TaxID=1525 RepID=A0AAC9MUN8_NEOTH|nr:XdhC/CoxI family protein [Moorella thermoacetica]AOQ24973.1 putative xanthine dehydrogenase subunit A [Moorella thermoacetica]TYL15485.1 putative xanthine dehydrogenase subunit A [Moorella thermoacetica]